MFRLLGPFDIGGAADVVWSANLLGLRRRERLLLGLLLLEFGRQVSVERLVELLWDDAPPPGARRTVQSHVSRLREALSTCESVRIVTRGAGYLVEGD